MASLSPVPKLQFFDNNGNLLAGGKLYSYIAGTSTPQNTYIDTNGTVANTNPIILDTRGEANVWLGTDLVYKLKLTDKNDVEIWTVDYVNGDLPLSAPTGASLVGFIQAGTNAVCRTALDKMREVITSADFNNANGYQNVGLGPNVFCANQNGGNLNTAVGHNSMTANTTGACNTAFGSLTMVSNTTGYLNVAIAWGALSANTTGLRNIGIGGNALCTTTTGCDNVAVGVSALRYNVVGCSNTAMGRAALVANTADANTGIGFNALSGNSCGAYNTGVGYQVLYYNSTGCYNSALGTYALFCNLTGTDNTAIGTSALYANSSGSQNVAAGRGALTSNICSTGNTAVGYQALTNGDSNYNTAVGWNAINSNVSGHDLVGIGVQALLSNTVGIENVGIGRNSLYSNIDGGQNVSIGSYNLSSNTSGIGNTSIGHNALHDNITGCYNSALGINALNGGTCWSNASGVGFAAVVTGSDQVQLGNALTTTYAYGAVQNRSDLRDKADIRDTQLGLDFIKSLRPVDFKWDYREDYKSTDFNLELPVLLENATEDQISEYKIKKADFDQQKLAWIESNRLANLTHNGSKKRTRFHHGLIAQEVKALLDTKGIDFGGYQDHLIKGGDDVKSLGYEEFIAPIIKAIQDLDDKVSSIKTA